MTDNSQWIDKKKKHEIFRERSRNLGRKAEEQIEDEGYLKVVQFLLGSENYSIESRFIIEIFPLKDLTTIPGAPEFIRGIINYRGQILSILDLKRFFSLPMKGISNLNKILVLQNNNMQFGVLADDIQGLKRIPPTSIQPGISCLSTAAAQYVRGITPESVIILDAEKILSDPRMVVDG